VKIINIQNKWLFSRFALPCRNSDQYDAHSSNPLEIYESAVVPKSSIENPRGRYEDEAPNSRDALSGNDLKPSRIGRPPKPIPLSIQNTNCVLATAEDPST